MKKRSYAQSSIKSKSDQGRVVNANTLELRWMDEKTTAPLKKTKKRAARPTNPVRETVFIHNIALGEKKGPQKQSSLLDPILPIEPTSMLELTKMINPIIEIVEVPPALLAPEVAFGKKDSILDRRNELKNMAIIYPDDIVNEGITREKISISSEILMDKTIDSNIIASKSIGVEHLQDHAVTAVKLAPAAVEGKHIQSASIQTDHYAKSSIDGSILKESIIANDHIIDGAITGDKIALQSIHGEHLAQESLQAEHIAKQAINSEHLDAGAIRLQHLSEEFTPFGFVEKAKTLEQYGLLNFHFAAKDKNVELVIEFNKPFADENYAIVAMTSHPNCHAVLKEQTCEAAIMELVRLKQSGDLNCMLTWIAMGNRA